jgi:hypothetical protein
MYKPITAPHEIAKKTNDMSLIKSILTIHKVYINKNIILTDFCYYLTIYFSKIYYDKVEISFFTIFIFITTRDFY